MNKALVAQDYWDSSYEHCTLDIATPGNAVRTWIEKHVAENRASQPLTVMEVGCFPGRFLAVFGEMGYEVHGIDLTVRVERDLPDFLRRRGCQVGRFIRRDFMEVEFDRQYDIVASFGFIEHFADWKTVLLKQASLVKHGGYLIVEVPNFRGWLQRMLHWLVDRENLSRHNLAAMKTGEWTELLVRAGFDIQYCGCFGGFAFWVDDQPRNYAQKVTLALMHRLVPLLSRVLTKNACHYSPYCGLVAQRSSCEASPSERQ